MSLRARIKMAAGSWVFLKLGMLSLEGWLETRVSVGLS